MPLFIQLTGSAIALAAFTATQAGWITATLKIVSGHAISGTTPADVAMVKRWGHHHRARAPLYEPPVLAVRPQQLRLGHYEPRRRLRGQHQDSAFDRHRPQRSMARRRPSPMNTPPVATSSRRRAV
jgi:hypothetical protein